MSDWRDNPRPVPGVTRAQPVEKAPLRRENEVLRDYAREAAKLANLEFSRWVERAVRQTMARESADRAMVAASERGECGTCGYSPCACDQQ